MQYVLRRMACGGHGGSPGAVDPRGEQTESWLRCDGERPRVEVPLVCPEIVQQACQQVERVPVRVSTQDRHLDQEAVGG